MINNISEKINLIIDNDDIQAGFDLHKALKETSASPNNSTEKNEQEKLLSKLECYLLPVLSSDEFINILRTKIVPFMTIETNLKEKISLRLMTYPEDSQKYLRLEYLKILLENQENIGQKKIPEWLTEYDRITDGKKATSLERKEFLQKNDEARTLSESEKVNLFKVLDLYDYLTPEIRVEELHDVAKKDLEQQLPTTKYKVSSQPDGKKHSNSITTSLTDALKYSEINDQLITSFPLKISNRSETVRPTIKNWLADYTFSVGYGAHNSMIRNNYLFQNSNTKILNSADREKLAYILKSFDEQTPVTVDTTNKQIIFPSFTSPNTRPQSPTYNPPIYNPTPVREFKPASVQQTPPSPPINNQPITSSRPVYDLESHDNHYQTSAKPIFSPAKPVQAENIKFSSSQKLPFEKEMEKKRDVFSAPEINKIHDMYRTEQSASRPKTEPTENNFSSSLHDKWERQESWPNKTPLISHERTIPIQPTPNPPQPLRIHPVSPYNGNNNGHNNKHETDEEELPKNVVNLKNS